MPIRAHAGRAGWPARVPESQSAASRARLLGVAETALLTLYLRATEARRDRGVLHDPTAVTLLDTLDYPFEQRFEGFAGIAAQGEALRAKAYDHEVSLFLREYPDATVISLGEGLDTQFWRVDNGHVRWLSIDLPEVVELRRQKLPQSPRLQTLACSAQDPRWMAAVDEAARVALVAKGLLSYFTPDEARTLISTCAERFRGGRMLFDVTSSASATRTGHGSTTSPRRYRVPPMPWGIEREQRHSIQRFHPNIIEVSDIRIPRGHGLCWGYLSPALRAAPRLSKRGPSYLLLEFGPG